MSISTHPLYIKLKNMQRRCNNPKDKSFKDYGAKGIKVCQEWHDNPLAFMIWSYKNGYRKGLQIDRIDNDKGYSPDNCRYVTRQENMQNRREIQSNNTSGYRGVSRKTYRDGSIRWVATVFQKGKNKVVGTFKDAEFAALVRYEYLDKYSNSALKRGNI